MAISSLDTHGYEIQAYLTTTLFDVCDEDLKVIVLTLELN